jgi:hypothetical protein
MELIKYKCDDTLQAATRRAYGHGTIVYRNKHRIFLTTLFIEAYQKPLSFTVRTYAHTHTLQVFFQASSGPAVFESRNAKIQKIIMKIQKIVGCGSTATWIERIMQKQNTTTHAKNSNILIQNRFSPINRVTNYDFLFLGPGNPTTFYLKASIVTRK